MLHIPVLLNETFHTIKDIKSGIIIDATFGFGSYSRFILDNLPKEVSVVAIDRDKNVECHADKIKEEYKERFSFVLSRFSNLESIILSQDIQINDIRAIVYDFGLSSMQIDNVDQGFSFQINSKLNMQMGFSKNNANTVVNRYSEKRIADILFKYGDEPLGRKIAREICYYRKKKDIETNFELIEVIKKCFPPKLLHGKIHFATRTFQAIRMEVNQELKEIEESLEFVINNMSEGTIISSVSFHSGEDRLVKHIFNKYSNKILKNNINRYDLNRAFLDAQMEDQNIKPKLKITTKKPIIPTEEEVKNNIRSRSGKLRSAVLI